MRSLSCSASLPSYLLHKQNSLALSQFSHPKQALMTLKPVTNSLEFQGKPILDFLHCPHFLQLKIFADIPVVFQELLNCANPTNYIDTDHCQPVNKYTDPQPQRFPSLFNVMGTNQKCAF